MKDVSSIYIQSKRRKLQLPSEVVFALQHGSSDFNFNRQRCWRALKARMVFDDSGANSSHKREGSNLFGGKVGIGGVVLVRYFIKTRKI